MLPRALTLLALVAFLPNLADGFTVDSLQTPPRRGRGRHAIHPIPSLSPLRLSFKDPPDRVVRNAPQNQLIKNVQIPLAILYVSQFLLFIGVGAVIPAIPIYGQEIGLSQASNGIVISAPALALLLGAKFGGNFADVARKPAMLLGMAVITVSDIGTAFSTTLPALILARLGLGAGRCFAESGERGMLADLAGQFPTLRGRALAVQQALIALGIAVGAPLGGLVLEEYGPRASFLCVSAGAFVALSLYSFLPETVNRSTDVDGTLVPEASGVEQDWQELLTDSRWRALALSQCGASFGYAAKISTIPLLASQLLPGGAAAAGALLSATGLSGLVGAPVGGWLKDRVGAKTTATVCGIVSSIGLALIPVALNSSVVDVSQLQVSLPFLNESLQGGGAAFALLVILWSLAVSAQGPALTAYAQELAPAGSEATALALPRAAGDGTYIVAPFLLGAFADLAWTGTGYECALAGSASLVGMLILFASPDSRTSREIGPV